MVKHLKTIIIGYFLIFCIMPFIIIFFSGGEEGNGINDYARITDVAYKAELVDEPSNGGKVIITEKLTYDIHAASQNNLFWELWRDLPEDYVDGLKVDYKVNYVKQLNNDGTETIYTESPKLYWDDSDYTDYPYGPGKWYHSVGPYNEDYGNYECVFFYVDGLYREKVTFEIQYEMNNAALRYSDVSELYLSMYSEETINHLNSFKGQILIPYKDMPAKNNFVAHTYGTKSHTFDYTESATINPGYYTFLFDLDKEDLKFSNYNEYLEFSLLAFNEDKHIFTNFAPDNYYSDDVYLEEALAAIEEYDSLPIKAKKDKTLLFVTSIIISVLIVLYVLRRDKKIRKKANLYESTMQIKYFRDIPSDLDPHFAATLVFSKHKNKIDVGNSYSAILLNLVRKGYIELQKIDNSKNWVFDNISINVLYISSIPDSINNILSPNNNEIISTKNSFSKEPLIKINLDNNLQNLTTTNTQQTQNNMINSNQQPQTDLLAQIQQPQIIERRNINGKLLEELSPNERLYFNLIIKHATKFTQPYSISMKDFQSKVSSDYDNTDTFVTSINKSIVDIGISKKYFQKSNYNMFNNSTNTLIKKYAIMGILILTIGNIIISTTRLDLAYGALFIFGLTLIFSSLYLKKFANKYVLFTQYGEGEYAKWRGLYNFLNSETLMKERSVIELPLWEKYLVYATAFGISEKVVKALEIRCPDVTSSQMLSNDYYKSNRFRTHGHSFKTSTNRASSISRSSRYGGGSYYGGGGRGGGGGGGGH